MQDERFPQKVVTLKSLLMIESSQGSGDRDLSYFACNPHLFFNILFASHHHRYAQSVKLVGKQRVKRM